MESDSLHSLKLLLNEDLYLVPEEIDQILSSEKTEPRKDVKKETTPTYDQAPHVDDSSVADEVKEPIAPIVRGQFAKGILILHEEDELADEVMDMLSKMVSAVNHSMSDVGLLSSEELKGKSLEDFQAINAHKVIKFGKISHPINALPIPSYQIKTEEETEYLFADSLTQISMDRALKKKLWENLQTLFNIS
ncbi:hypothetical protein [uncultured Algoriphagus sp.]|uniref:hypothetical protein n=1 Tax=uncultured Algoriphagus sp. TaxID=417365 RepID=UPI0025902A9D|nr:hypothetical protein [uncultured Algoriphagus sp.]